MFCLLTFDPCCRGKTDESDYQKIKQLLTQSQAYLAVPTNKTVQQQKPLEGASEKQGDSEADQKNKANPRIDLSTASSSSPNDVKPAELGVRPDASKAPAQSEQTKKDATSLAQNIAKLSVQPKSKYPAAMPKVKMNLKYKPMKNITAAEHHIYHVPKVYCDSLNFNWRERDFEITCEERHFLRDINSQIRNGMITISANA